MKRKQSPASGRMWLVAITLFLGWLVTAPAAHAQCTLTNAAGNNTVYGKCSGSVTTQGSSAYIDASAVPQGIDICATIFSIINGLSGSGTVIDARGITTGLSCAANNTPWIQGSTASTNPATLLLPAGTITIANTWIMPQYSKLIGQGPGLTTISPSSGFAAGSDTIDAMIEMGSQSATLGFCNGTANNCVGVGVQDLTVNLNAAAIQYGIYNATSQETSFVDNVVFNNVGNSTTITSALEVAVVSGPSSSNSGPYSNLVCNIASGARAETRCVDLLAHTRGVHGISCNGGTASPTAAIYLDSDGDTIHDVYINGFLNGIYVGSQAATLATLPQSPSNLLYNINGGSSVTNLIHISSNTTTNAHPVCPGSSSHQAVCDLTIMNVTAAANTTILDDLNLPGLTVTGGDANVGVYILGEQIGSSTTPPQYTRFTTSPRVPTWGTGTSAPSSSCTANGALYSDVSTGSSGGLYACINLTWTKIP